MIRTVAFLSRVALICNICFLISLLLHFLPGLRNGAVFSTIVILGRLVAIPLNLAAIIGYGLLTFTGKEKKALKFPWLQVINTLFLIVQFLFLIK